MARAIGAAVFSRPENDRLAELSEEFWAHRNRAASLIIAAAQSEGVVDSTVDPTVVVKRIVGPIWFRSMVLRQPVDEDFVESLVYSVA
jgi:hypothetical protein